MRRAPLVAAGTALGAAGVLAFPVQHPQLAGLGPSAAATLSAAAGAAPASAASATSVTSATPAAAAAQSATGAGETFRFGAVTVKVAVVGGKITNVSVANLQEYDGRSAAIDSYAIPQLEQQAIGANSANIQGVSGATFTSRAFAASLSSALAKLGFQG